MMRMSVLFLLMAASGYAQTPAHDVIARRFGADAAGRVAFQSCEAASGGCDTFKVISTGEAITVAGSSPVAQCKGFYTWLRANDLGFAGWAGDRCAITADSPLPKTIEPLALTSPVQHHYYFNVVTYGYTMPYWNWERWEKEIDWMALHGIDMPLALVANEAIATRVWQSFGLTQSEIDAFYTGPAHLPWQRMGNITGVDGTLPASWHADQIALQHKILGRMRALGMKPICPAFAGFIPEGMKRRFSDLKANPLSWGGFPAKHRALILSPDDARFAEIGKRFIREWEKEFGACGYYLADSFNEMDLPKGTGEERLAHYGEVIYRSIADASPDAIWVMQGWMFGYQRNIWTPANLRALLSKVPDDKMLILDLAADYSKHVWRNGMNWDFYSGFFNKPWVYSVIPNMGGKTGFTGHLDFYANGHLEALRSPNRGRLAGIGMAPEGIENNELIYELLTDTAWKETETDLTAWYRSYAISRYGKCPATLETAFALLRKSVYGSFTDHPRFNWQFRPTRSRKGSTNLSDDFFAAAEAFASVRAEMKESPLYRADLAELTALYLAGKMELRLRKVLAAVDAKKFTEAKADMDAFFRLGALADAILEQHPNLRLDSWVGFADGHGGSLLERAAYQANARRIITLWGPPVSMQDDDLRGYVEDYSARLWGGLTRDFHLPRWRIWFDAVTREPKVDYHRAMRAFELDFIYGQSVKTPPLEGDLMALCDQVW